MKLLFIVFLFMNAALYGQRSDFGQINFKKADSIATVYKGASLKNLPVLAHNLTTDLPTEAEKFRAIYTWVCTNIENDYNAYQKTIRKRKKLYKNKEALTAWNDSYKPRVFNNLLKNKKTSCTGYAYITRELAQLVDINCKIVNGYGRTPTLRLDENSIPNHSWNTVELNGKWYLCDPTWSAGKIIIEDKGPRFEPNYFDGYFLANPKLFIRNHYPLNINSSLLANPPSYKEFTKGPVVYKEAFKLGIIPKKPLELSLETVKNNVLTFTLSSEAKVNNKFTLDIFNGTSTRKVTPQQKTNKNNHEILHTFEKTGLYDVLIKLDDKPLVSYSVKVKRK